MNSNINLGKLTDCQKLWITQMSYLNFKKIAIDKISTVGIKLS